MLFFITIRSSAICRLVRSLTRPTDAHTVAILECIDVCILWSELVAVLTVCFGRDRWFGRGRCLDPPAALTHGRLSDCLVTFSAPTHRIASTAAIEPCILGCEFVPSDAVSCFSKSSYDASAPHCVLAARDRFEVRRIHTCPYSA